MMKAVLIISHGSRSPKTKQELQSLIEVLKKKSKIELITDAYLELEKPSIPEGIDWCVEGGATSIIVALNFLNSGRHVDEDIPNIIKESQRKHPTVRITLTSPIGQHPKINDLFLDLIQSN
jgi:sirohydrochlorin ferrochelatase